MRDLSIGRGGTGGVRIARDEYCDEGLLSIAFGATFAAVLTANEAQGDGSAEVLERIDERAVVRKSGSTTGVRDALRGSDFPSEKRRRAPDPADPFRSETSLTGTIPAPHRPPTSAGGGLPASSLFPRRPFGLRQAIAFMTLPKLLSTLRPPHIVATGFTTALLGDERTLREFVVGDHVVQALRSRGDPAVLYLINDSYDPLNERQLRIGVKKDAGRIEQLRPFCGRPIAEIPDPYGCHASYSGHFASHLTARLNALCIHPIVLDTYEAYENGHYGPFIAQTFEHYDEIREELERLFGYVPRSLFRAQCPRCRSIDATKITRIDALVSYRCERCSAELSAEVGALRGKLNWKLDCAARWNLYGIGTEVFSKPHMHEMGTFNVSCHVSRRWFGAHVPVAVEYGNLRISSELSGKLLEVLPPAGLKQMLLEPLTRDLVVTRSSLEHFADSYEVRPGTSYTHFVREELPRRALELDCADWRKIGTFPIEEERTSEQALLAHANAYSELVHGRRHGLRQPEATVIADADPGLVEFARDAVAIAIAVRRERHEDEQALKARLKIDLKVRPMPGVYSFLRRVLGQEHGPNITTLLAILPLDYLAMVHFLLDVFVGSGRPKASVPSVQEAA